MNTYEESHKIKASGNGDQQKLNKHKNDIYSQIKSD